MRFPHLYAKAGKPYARSRIANCNSPHELSAEFVNCLETLQKRGFRELGYDHFMVGVRLLIASFAPQIRQLVPSFRHKCNS